MQSTKIILIILGNFVYMHTIIVLITYMSRRVIRMQETVQLEKNEKPLWSVCFQIK